MSEDEDDSWRKRFSKRSSRRKLLTEDTPKAYGIYKAFKIGLGMAITEAALSSCELTSTSSSTSTTSTSPSTPNNYIISLFSSDDNATNRDNCYLHTLHDIGDVESIPDNFTGSPYTISDKPIPIIIDKIRTYIKNKRSNVDPNFSLDNLVFAGHGDRNKDLANGDQNILMIERGVAADGTPILDEFPAADFMDALVALQKELDKESKAKGNAPTPMAKRIILGECRTFAQLQNFPDSNNPDYINKYHETAHALKAQIVGCLTNVYTDQQGQNPVVGYFVRFNPDGKTVAWDEITSIANYKTYCTDLGDCDNVELNGQWTKLKFPPPQQQALSSQGAKANIDRRDLIAGLFSRSRT